MWISHDMSQNILSIHVLICSSKKYGRLRINTDRSAKGIVAYFESNFNSKAVLLAANTITVFFPYLSVNLFSLGQLV